MGKCRECKYAKFKLTEKGNIRTSVAGECLYHIEVPKMPRCVARQTNSDMSYAFHKYAIWSGDDKDCTCFEKKKDVIMGFLTHKQFITGVFVNISLFDKLDPHAIIKSILVFKLDNDIHSINGESKERCGIYQAHHTAEDAKKIEDHLNKFLEELPED